MPSRYRTRITDPARRPELRAVDAGERPRRVRPGRPVIATGLDPATLVIRTLVEGAERQNDRASDLVSSVAQLVSRISKGLTLEPGDIISRGTSNRAASIKPGATVEASI